MEESQPEHEIEKEIAEQEQKPAQPENKPDKEMHKEKKPGIFSKLKDKFGQYRRTIEVARKPTKEEYTASLKITGMGILLLGLIGFIIYVIYHLAF